MNIQLYPPTYTKEDLETAWAQGYQQGWKDSDSASFSRGVQNCYWFFYRILNGGKQKSPSGEAQA